MSETRNSLTVIPIFPHTPSKPVKYIMVNVVLTFQTAPEGRIVGMSKIERRPESLMRPIAMLPQPLEVMSRRHHRRHPQQVMIIISLF